MSCKDNLVIVFCFVLTIHLVVESHSSIPTANQIKNKINNQIFMSNLQRQIKAKEEELKNAENINKGFERMIQLVNILGQVDNFLNERTKAVIKKLALLVEDEEELKKHYHYSDSEEDDD